MIKEILPRGVVAVEAFGDDPSGAALFPEEERVIARAFGLRRREFTTVRGCARRALAGLGVPPAPIVPDAEGAPRWPAGVVGAMTHCPGYRAAAVARATAITAIGIDAERNEPLPGSALARIGRPEERAALPALAAAEPGVHWDRLLFSAKESIYKAWFPLAGRWLGFGQALVIPDPAAGTFTAHLLVEDRPAELGQVLTGRWLLRDGLVLTALALPR